MQQKLKTQEKTRSKYIEPDVRECQLTSSKVKVEDLVTDKEKLQDKEDDMLTSQSTCSFWDRPIPCPQHDWPHDPRMPNEWNTVIESMREYKGNCTIPRGEIYRQPEEDEISEPEEFMN